MYSQNNNCKVHSHLYAPISKDIDGYLLWFGLGFPWADLWTRAPPSPTTSLAFNVVCYLVTAIPTGMRQNETEETL